jgi:hypothetical protein
MLTYRMTYGPDGLPDITAPPWFYWIFRGRGAMPGKNPPSPLRCSLFVHVLRRMGGGMGGNASDLVAIYHFGIATPNHLDPGDQPTSNKGLWGLPGYPWSLTGT